MWKSNSTCFHGDFSTSQLHNVENYVENVNYFNILYNVYNNITTLTEKIAINYKGKTNISHI